MTEPRPTSTLDDSLEAARAALGTPQQIAQLRDQLARRLAGGRGDELIAQGALLQKAQFGWPKSWVVAGGVGVIVGAVWLLAPREQEGQGGREAENQNHAAPEVPAVRVEVALPPPVLPEPVLVVPSASAPSVSSAPYQSAVPPAKAQKLKSASAVVPVPADPEAELRLLNEAHHLLSTHPRQALVPLKIHEHRFPEGILSEERDALRIDAELVLDARDKAAALEHARAFVLRYPHSAHTRRLQRLIDTYDAEHKSARVDTPTE